jgi:hypothetical protein
MKFQSDPNGFITCEEVQSMTDNVQAETPGSKLSSWQALVGIIDRPRSTLRAIGEQPRYRWILPLILMIAGIVCLSVVTAYRMSQETPRRMQGQAAVMSSGQAGGARPTGQPRGTRPQGQATAVPTEQAGAAAVPTEQARGTRPQRQATAVPTEQAGAAAVPTEQAGATAVPTEQAGAAQFQRQMMADPVLRQVIPPATRLLSSLLGWVLFAGVLYGIGLLLGGRAGYGQLFAVVSWSWVPYILRDFFQAGYIYVTGRFIRLPGLSFLVAAGEQAGGTANLIYRALAQVDIFLLWHLLLIGLAIAALNRFGRGKTLFVTLIYLLIVIGVALIIPVLLRPIIPDGLVFLTGGGLR